MKRHLKRGMSLIEVMIAVGIFALAGVASARAIAELAELVVMVQREDQLRERMRSYLDELKSIRLVPGQFTINEDEQGYSFKVRVEELELFNEAGDRLNGLYAVEVELFYEGDGRSDTYEAKYFLYQP
jgi:prepilin-type N-terminal cleavage/methylation domain-containing protein